MKLRALQFSSKKQDGAVLVVALIILTALTLVGVSSMQSTTLEMRMASSSVGRSKSFSATEAVISDAIGWIEANINSYDDLHDRSPQRFNADCTNGLCFFGSYDIGMAHTYECSLDDTGLSPNTDVPSDDTESVSIWSPTDVPPGRSGSHSTYRWVRINNTAVVKYIIEFKCFVGRDRHAPYGPYLGGNDEADPLFIITAYLEPTAGRPPVMIQVSHTVRI